MDPPKRKPARILPPLRPAPDDFPTPAPILSPKHPPEIVNNASTAATAAVPAVQDTSKSVELPPPRPKVAGGKGSGGYRPPSWAPAVAPTDTGLSLTVLKGGVEVSTISLDNRTHCLLGGGAGGQRITVDWAKPIPCEDRVAFVAVAAETNANGLTTFNSQQFIFDGRQQGVVDVLLEHPSISRQHAILQYGDKGSLFLFDNGSTHGCTVNKKKITSKEYHRLSVGDVIKFGESTRLYVLEGPQELLPAEYESDNLRQLRQDAARKQLAAKIAKVKAGGAGGAGDSGEYGISWGFDEDAVAEASDEEGEEDADGEGGEVELPDYLKTEAQKRRRRDTKTGVSEDSVHKRDAKLFEKLRLKLSKVEHLLTENERITAKEGSQGGLTEGQQAQLARNDKAIAAVRLQVEEIEESIRQKNRAREQGKQLQEAGGNDAAARSKEEKGMEGDDDDDYYDRTAPVKASSARTTESGAVSKKEEIRARRFAPRDKTKKLLSTADAGAAVTTPGALRAGTDDGEEGGAGTAAQSFEALTRRNEAVADDLDRTEKGLAELEAEEAEEALENMGSEGETAADPLDAFMASNRQNARKQALERLSTKRDALRKEQSRLKFMMDAARPSMPELKAPASIPASPVEAGTATETNTRVIQEGVDPNVPGSTDQRGSNRPTGEQAHQMSFGKSTTPAKMAPPAFTGNPARDAGHDGGKDQEMRTMNEPDERRPGSGEIPPHAGARAMASPPTAASFPGPSAVSLPRPSAVGEGGAKVDEVRNLSTVSSDRGIGGGDEGGGRCDEAPPSPAQAAKSGSSSNRDGAASSTGVKRREISTAEGDMEPPPAAKRSPQWKTPLSTLKKTPSQEQPRDPGITTKRTVKGPAAMPPPSVTASSATAANTTNVAGMSEGGGNGVKKGAAAAGALLEGGDADWVPPEGQSGDGRTALNLKFGY